MITVNTPEEFREAMAMIAQATQEDFLNILKKLTNDAFTSVVRRTPVDTGYLRENWEISVDSREIEGEQPDGYRIELGTMIMIYNNTEYLIYVENGTPKMRAQPMIRPTEQMLMRTAEKLVRALSRQGYNI